MLRAERITKRYRTPGRSTLALDGVSLTIEPGARVGLAGPSASGKTTLAMLLAMLLRPDAGALYVDGEQVTGWSLRAPARQRRRVQLLWQSPRLAADPRMRVRDLVLEPLVANRLLPTGAKPLALLNRWADLVGLTPELLDRYPHEISEGQLQRALLARALVVEPRYLICDEPTSMLDVSTQAALLRTIADVQADTGLAVLLITHDTGLATHWCDTVHDLRDLTARGHLHGACGSAAVV